MVLSLLWRWRVVLAALLFLFVVFSRAPASLLIHVSNGVPQLWMAMPTGTLWHGRSPQMAVIVGGGAVDLGEVEWRLSPWSLLLLNPQLELDSRRGSQRLSLQARVSPLGAVSLTDIDGRLPLSIAEPWLPLLIDGQLQIDVPQLALNSSGITDIAGELVLANAVWQGADMPMALGEYHIALSFPGDRVNADISDRGAKLAAKGTLVAGMSGDSAGQYQLNVNLRAAPGLAPEIGKSIGWLGSKQSDGSVLVKQSGSWK